MKTHTPGPWHLGMRPGPMIYGPLGEQVADLRGLTLEKYESIANAHLIASAPDLLSALELIYSNAGESPEWIRSRIGPVIEKAIGESESLARKIKAKGNQ